ncbi:AP2 domain-containing protein [Clostridium tetani]|uniref:hypothetical protein n=1 Tax=Clostridium tetani TaxID=1513 RepID=UPI002955D7DF|nr:hypothetical protein [Clostridium tetani]BDR66982.1 AP2 domain-containing protein [Clostridium tetani]
MGKVVDRIGERFGRLIVLARAENDKHGHAQWLCKCDCGNEKVVVSNNLISGNTRSCGCGEWENRKRNGRRCVTSGDLKKANNKDRFKGTKINNITMKVPKHNTSGYKGIYWNKEKKKWEVRIELQGKRKFLGYFDSKEDAIKARKEAEEKYFKPIIEEYKSVIKL